jgi:hypothetical protein
MPYFAYVKDGTVKYVQFISSSSPSQEKWIALNRSGVSLKETTKYNVMPGDLFIDGKFYKKDLENDSTTLLEEAEWTHPNSIRFAGIMDGEIVGQWGLATDLFDTQDDVNDLVDSIVNSEIIELNKENQFLVKKGWLYDGVNFTDPDNV